ncbi:MAG: AraC family transcriptional regulator [Pseudomonadales bacterium]|nr:AraC family transcriptional regulator [Pseudomonadales bacterium]
MLSRIESLVEEARTVIESKDINIPIRYAGLLYTAIKDHWRIDTDALFANSNIPQKKIHEQNYFINFEDFLTFCNNGIALTGTTEIAVEFGKRLVLPAHGAWGLAVMTSPTLYDAIMLFKKYVTLELPFFIFDYQEQGEYVVVAIKSTAAIEERLQFHHEYIVIAEAINFLYAIKDNSDLEIHCAYRTPSYGHRYSEVIGRQVTFNSTFTGARFHRKHLNVAMPDANHASHLMLMNGLQGQNTDQQTQRSMSQILTDYLSSLCFQYPDQETVARQLNISARKLRYCLKDENTNYKTLIADLKKHDAILCLKDGLSVSQTALKLGYDDASNFARAFRKWYGVSPSNYRSILPKTG